MIAAQQQSPPLDMTQLLSLGMEIAEMINCSAEVADYLFWKHEVEHSQEALRRAAELNRKKDLFDECQRFGHYHPNYHKALEEAQAAEARLEELEEVRRFKQAETVLDELLLEISRTVAYSVSDTIKVPSNNPLPTKSGCGSGGSCSCG
ncbi:YlbF family regulator [Paenibacillus sp. y28]|uniref:YlbF family regulator n=1 Tax=Paenibacillus sp. y28 TaxID=3129110 RepID=UPI003019AA65